VRVAVDKKDEADIYYSERENALTRRKSIRGIRTSGRTRSQKVREIERERESLTCPAIDLHIDDV